MESQLDMEAGVMPERDRLITAMDGRDFASVRVGARYTQALTWP
jgi:hypothetical protein